MITPLSIAFLNAIGPYELLILFAIILLLFGPRRLPEIARIIGKAVEQLRRASQDFRDQVMNLDEPPEDHAYDAEHVVEASEEVPAAADDEAYRTPDRAAEDTEACEEKDGENELAG
jgi:TatA/E family protein of Tat protein translocase